MLFGDERLLSTIFLKLFDAVNGHYGTLSCVVCYKIAIFMQFSDPMEAHMAKNNTEICLW